MEEPPKKLSRNIKFLILLLIILSAQMTISIYQYSRYNIENYCCRHMSRDCEYFFESIGISTWQVSGDHYNATGVLDVGHQWILLDFGLVAIPFESTLLLPFFDPVWRGFKNLEISPGYVNPDGSYNTDLSWSTWV